MGTNSLQAAAPRRRSFSLPSFGRSSAAERQDEVLKNADKMARSSVEEAARIQKAAAWQWYTRGVGDTVVLTPARLPVGNSQAPANPGKSCIGASGLRSKGGKAKVCNGKIMEPPLSESQYRAASRFKAEAGLSFTRPVASGGAPPAVPAPTAPSGGASPPLYDELELSSLRTHMADLVQRLQHQPTPDNEQSSPAVGDHGRSRPAPPPSVSIDYHQTEAPPAVAVASSHDHQLKTLPSSPAPVVSAIPFHRKPLSALQKLFRKVLSGSIPKCTKNSSQIIDSAVPAVCKPAELLYNDVNRTPQYHHYHYIHHHHHHHHFSKNPEEQASIILSRRRHSESGSSRPCTPSLAVEADSGEEEDEDDDEERRIAAYLARRRRRQSDSFSKYQLLPGNAGFDKDEGMKEESAKDKQFSRRYNSERFLPSKIPIMLGKDIFAQAVEDEFDEGTFAGIIRSRRRHSAERHREEPSLERTGGKSKGGPYRLGGAGACGGTPASMTMGRRRHSESSKVISREAGAKPTPSPGRPYWASLSARDCVNVQERHNGVSIPATPGLYP